MGSGNRGGFVVDKGGGEAPDCDFGLGLKMIMMGNHHDNHQSHHGNDESGTKFAGFSGDHGTGGGCSGGATGGVGGDGCFGAMFSTNNNHESTAVTTTMYGLVGVGGVSPASCVASSVQRSPHAFNPPSFKSWGEALMGLGGGGELTRVFTASQRQELERQTIIYKYMAASMPVPPELLIPITSKYSLPPYQSNDHGSGGGGKSGMDLRYTIGSRDAEPWRCRRTDGKKWRCSRDVAPDQKYCERHSHKGRPSRSRKHVESSSSLSSTSASSTLTSISIARNNNNSTLIPPSSSTSSAVNPASINIKPSFLYQPYQNPSHSRFPEWFMKREAHHHHDQSTGGVPNASPFSPQTELDQMTPTHFHHPSRANNSLMGNDQTHSPTLPRQFLDAWSIGPKPDGIVEITGKPVDSASSLLTLSMAGSGGSEEAERLGMGLFEHERERGVGGSGGGGERYSWMGSPAPGGPLAEALCLGIVGADASGSRGAHGHGESGGQGLGYNK